MTGNLELPTLDWPLERQCDFMAQVYQLWHTGVSMVTLREKGEDALYDLRYRMLRKHQKAMFLEGLRKLGVDPKGEPPAVVAAKYHYLSNILGGFDLEYIEESPKKVWIRYRAPQLNPYGTGFLAMTARVGRVTYATWHAHNGELLDCPRLRYVCTKSLSDFEPYAEGYFEECDRDLEPWERILYQPVTASPDFDPAKAPRLDPAQWPPERRARTRRKYELDFLRDTVLVVLEMFGLPTATHLVRQGFGGIAVQYSWSLLGELGIKGADARGLATFAAALSALAGEEPELDSPAQGKYIVRPTRPRLFRPGEVPLEIYQAPFAFIEMTGRMMSARIKVTLAPGDEGPTVIIEDVPNRLF
ncbi:MAG: hypothetical protein HY683_00840 [Chloroflexi bacterium]|nr:hypothetical protein [Chloroflexota bacterium]